MTQIEKIKAEIERIDRECQGKQYYIPARHKLDELRTFIDSLEKDEAQKRLEELRRIRAEKNRLDEAAFTYENELWESGYKNCGYSPQEVNDAFKAGAEYSFMCRGFYQEGYEQAEKDMIERACEYLFKHYAINIGEFKKAMEEEYDSK